MEHLENRHPQKLQGALVVVVVAVVVVVVVVVVAVDSTPRPDPLSFRT